MKENVNEKMIKEIRKQTNKQKIKCIHNGIKNESRIYLFEMTLTLDTIEVVIEAAPTRIA